MMLWVAVTDTLSPSCRLLFFVQANKTFPNMHDIHHFIHNHSFLCFKKGLSRFSMSPPKKLGRAAYCSKLTFSFSSVV